jgi:hypothetical protein
MLMKNHLNIKLILVVTFLHDPCLYIHASLASTFYTFILMVLTQVAGETELVSSHFYPLIWVQ